MFVTVKLLNGSRKTLTYKVPALLHGHALINKLVLVPLRNSTLSAIVTEQFATMTKASFEIREILGLKTLPADPFYTDFVQKSARLYFTDDSHFYHKLHKFLEEKAVQKDPAPSFSVTLPLNTVTLTTEQNAAAQHLISSLDKQEFSPLVLHGVTGSGKTEVYNSGIRAALSQDKTVILLLPEVSLAQQFERIFKTRLFGVPVFGFHSGTTPREKKIVWQALLSKQPCLIIGVHLPVLLPIHNLGLIIIDEEHEGGFEEKKHPKINSKYLAIMRAHHYKIPIVLGSATPSIQTLFNVQSKKWPLFQLTQRFAGAFPKIQKVVLPLQTKGRISFWISRELESELKKCLASKKQAIIFINRRGYSFFLQCKKCGFVAQCRACSVSLTTHQGKDPQDLILQCHYCDFKRVMPTSCPECSASKGNLLTKGIGTQQLVSILQDLLPDARIARADLDTTKKKDTWAATVQNFEKGEIDILVGTKSVTKGYHFPGVSLVGVIWGDLHAHLPAFNATEECLQQLIQVAGRAGREHPESTVIIQVMHDSTMFDFIDETQYINFAQQEITERKAALYPPFCRLVNIEIRHRLIHHVVHDADQLASFLRQVNDDGDFALKILGPTIPSINKIQDIHIRHIFLKTKTLGTLENLLTPAFLSQFKSSIFVQPI